MSLHLILHDKLKNMQSSVFNLHNRFYDCRIVNYLWELYHVQEKKAGFFSHVDLFLFLFNSYINCFFVKFKHLYLCISQMLFLQRYSCHQNVAKIKETYFSVVLMWCTLYSSRKDMMLAAMETPDYLTFPRWASTSTARHRPSHTPPARTSSPRTSLPLTSLCRTPNLVTRTLTWATRFISTQYTSLQHLISNSHGPDGKVKRPSGPTAGADSPVPFWAWKGVHLGCGGMVLGDRSFCLHMSMELIP